MKAPLFLIALALCACYEAPSEKPMDPNMASDTAVESAIQDAEVMTQAEADAAAAAAITKENAYKMLEDLEKEIQSDN